MSASEDGWQPAWVDPGSAQLVWITVPGTAVSLQVMRGTPQTIMGAVAADFNAYVQPLRDADSASYTPTNSVSTSNHLNGTAMDLNWNDHPFQVRGTFNAAQVAAIREILAFYEGWIFWAGDWNDPVDEMHWQLGYNTWGRDAANFIARKIRADGFSTFRRDVPAPPAPSPPTPAPTPSPAPDPSAAAIKALYDAVPVIDMARAAQLVQPVMAGLALAECNTVKRIAMALAQWGWESDGFATTEEYAKNGRYAPYIGRTWTMITWQSNYAAFGKWCVAQGLLNDPDYFVNSPTALADLKWAGIGAAWFWVTPHEGHNLINDDCDRGDIVAVTETINGGTNGLDVPGGRRARYQQAIALGDELLALIPPPAPPTPEGPLMALTDDEQHELLTKTREIWDQLRGPGGNGWPQLGLASDGNGLTPVDTLASVANNVKELLAATKKATP